MKSKLLLLVACFMLVGLGALASGDMQRMQPANLNRGQFSIFVANRDFGHYFRVFFKTDEREFDEFLSGQLEINDEDHQIATVSAEKKWTTNGLQFEFSVATNYLLASKFTILVMGHSGKMPMPAFSAFWFYLRDFGSNNLAVSKPEQSSGVPLKLAKTLPKKIKSLHRGMTADEVWKKLGIAEYKYCCGGEGSPDHDHWELNWNHEIDLTFEQSPGHSVADKRDGRRLIKASLFKNGFEISHSSVADK